MFWQIVDVLVLACGLLVVEISVHNDGTGGRLLANAADDAVFAVPGSIDRIGAVRMESAVPPRTFQAAHHEGRNVASGVSRALAHRQDER